MAEKVQNQTEELCPKFEYAFSLLGKKWTGLIIEVLLSGNCRFKDLSASIEGVSDRVLVERLKELEQEGIVTRPASQENNNRAGYCLTEKGYALRDVMHSVHAWADQWVTDCE